MIVLAQHVADGLNVLHKNGFMHRDITLSNILYTDSQHGRVFKIADMGLCKEIRSGQHRVYKYGSIHAAPEARVDGERLDEMADIWSDFSCSKS